MMRAPATRHFGEPDARAAIADRPVPLRIVMLGLSITSSWGNGHATTFRALVRALAERGHDVLFLERDRPWYAANRDLPHPPWGRTELYASVEELHDRFTDAIRRAELVLVGSYVPDGAAVAAWVVGVAAGVTVFYDIDTPVTLAKLDHGDEEYVSRTVIPRFDLYLSFTSGPILRRIERRYHARRARPLYCSFDPTLYYPEEREPAWALGYLGTYSDDRQPALERLLLEPARRSPAERFVVAGPQYPETIAWPANVERMQHLPPAAHRAFYTAQRFTLNVTRADMARVGYSPSVRLFEAAACGTPIISDEWEGLGHLFALGREILVARSADDVLRRLRDVPDVERRAIGARARRRVLDEHTPAHRAAQLEAYVRECLREKGEG